MSTVENEDLGMSAQVAKNKRQVAAKASGEELPVGTTPVEAQAEVEEKEDTSAESTAEMLATEETPAVVEEKPVEEEAETVRIAGKTFKNQKEAFEWAEKQEQERLLAEAHSQGIREAISLQQAQQPVVKEEEEDFDTKFYSDPKGTLQAIQRKATDEAIQFIRQETAKEKAWNEFLSEYPDIRRQDAENVLNLNAKTIGVLPWDEGRRALASAIYKEYDEIANLRKPKTELTNRKPTLAPSGGANRSVTPTNKEEKPLSFSDQLRKMKR